MKTTVALLLVLSLSSTILGYAQPGSRIEIKDNWYWLNAQRFFIKAIGYEIRARPGQYPYQGGRPDDLDLMAFDLNVIKKGGYNAIRTWSQFPEPQLKLVQDSGLKLIMGIEDLELAFEFADKDGKVIKTESILILASREPLALPKLSIAVTPGGDLNAATTASIKTTIESQKNSQIEGDLKVSFNPHLGWKVGPQASVPLQDQSDKKTILVENSFPVPDRCWVANASAGVAVINWSGITDVTELVEFWSSPKFTADLVGDLSRKEDIFRRCSPLTHINASEAPALTIHGDADRVVPFIHATLLREALTAAGVKNELHVVKGKKHGGFDAEELSRCFQAIWRFLDEVGVT